MAQATWNFTEPDTSSHWDMNKEWSDAQTANQQYVMNHAFSKNIDEKGNIDERGFYRTVKDLGGNMAAAQQAMAWHQSQQANDENTAQHNMFMRQMGGDPNAGGRNNAQFGTPSGEPQIMSGTDSSGNRGAGAQLPTAEEIKHNDALVSNLRSPSVVGTENTNKLVAAPAPTNSATQAVAGGTNTADQGQAAGNGVAGNGAQSELAKFLGMQTGNNNVAPMGQKQQLAPHANNSALASFLGMSQQAPPPPQAPQQSDPNGQQDLGQDVVTGAPNQLASGEEGKMSAPADSSAVYGAPGEDRRSAAQMVEDSIDPSKSMYGQGNGQGAGGYFQIDAHTDPAALQTIATNLQRNGVLAGGQPTVESVNDALKSQQDLDYKALGPPPGIQYTKEGKYDRTGTYNAQREYQAKIATVAKEWANKFGPQYAEQLKQKIEADGNNRAEAQMKNDIDAKNAGYKGMNDFASNMSTQAKGIGKLGTPLDPLKFENVADMQKFNARIGAFNSINTKPKDLADFITNAKNVAVAEGLSETEGMSSMLQMLGANGIAEKLQVALAHGAKLDPGTLVSIGALGALQRGALNFAQMKKSMALNHEVDAKRQTGEYNGAFPHLSGGAPQVAPSAPQASGAVDTRPEPAPPQADGSTWFNPTSGNASFTSKQGKQYNVASRDAAGLPDTVTDAKGNKFSVKDIGNGVELSPKEALAHKLGMRIPGSVLSPIPYKPGMTRDPNKVYSIPGKGNFYGDGRAAK